jgi:hypothetical protein
VGWLRRVFRFVSPPFPPFSPELADPLRPRSLPSVQSRRVYDIVVPVSFVLSFLYRHPSLPASYTLAFSSLSSSSLSSHHHLVLTGRIRIRNPSWSLSSFRPFCERTALFAANEGCTTRQGEREGRLSVTRRVRGCEYRQEDGRKAVEGN